MTSMVRWWIAGVMFATVCGLVYLSGPSQASEGGEEVAKAVKKIGAEMQKGNVDAAKKLVDATAKKIPADEIGSELMHLYRTRTKGGLGYGSKEGKNPANDGLEKKLQEFTKGVPANVAADVATNVEAANWMAALADLTLAKTPTKDQGGGKTKKAWIGWSQDLREATAEFAKAAAAKNGPGMAKAANKMNSACTSCHSKFKE